MLKLAWRGVRNNPGRYIATLVAIITGVAFYAATGFLSDRVIDSIEGDVNRQYANIDVAVVASDDTADAGDTGGYRNEQRITGDVADRIFSADGVTASAGVLSGRVAFLKPDGSTYGDDATGRLWITDGKLNPVSITNGKAPTAAGDIAVDQGLAKANDLEVGDNVTLLTLSGQAPARIVGITAFGRSDAIDNGGTVSLPEATAFDQLSSGRVEYEELYLRTDDDAAGLVKDLGALVPDGFTAETGDQLRDDKRSEIGAFGRYLKTALTAFAVLALLVGGFVIYNTFSVIVTQRLRELAVMAAIGATPRQIKRSLRSEGLVVGVLGSLIGVFVGFGMTYLLILVLDAFGISLPGSGLAIKPASVISAVFIGTVITVVSVMIPARKAARIQPIEALRVAAVEQNPLSVKRIAISATLVGLGAAAMLVGTSAALVGVGAVVLFVGVIVSGPVIAVLGARVLKPILSRFGLVARLAIDNTARNPQRTATTANALLIGVFLVTLVSVAGVSAKDYIVGEIQKVETADYLINSTGGTIDPTLVQNLQDIDGVTKVVPFRREAVTIDGKAAALSSGDLGDIREVAGIDLKDGSFDDLGEGTIAVIDDGDDTPAIGSTVTVTSSSGTDLDLKVVAVIKASVDSLTIGSFAGTATFDDLVGGTAPTVAFIDLKTGAQSDTKDAIESLTKLRPDITLTAGNYLGQLISGIFDFIINAVNGLLMISVVIALIGIVNTLSLSILERRRELGLLRAIGMTDTKVRRMVRVESMLIAGLGTVTGLLLGLFVGWALVRSIDRIAQTSVAFSLPTGRLILVLVLGVVLGLLASLIPARRSTKLDVLDSIQAT